MSVDSHYLIAVDNECKTPKYRQIVDSIVSGLEVGVLGIGDKLPSINELLFEFDVSRDTAVKAYNHLKDMDILESVPGKGFYIRDHPFKRRAKVLLIFNKLSAHKKIIYDAFAETLGDKASIDFLIYNNNFQLFKTWILENKDKPYTHFVIIPHFKEHSWEAPELINLIPKHKLILLDKRIKGVTGEYAAVYQDFARDIYTALTEAHAHLSKYRRLNLIFPTYSYHPREILDGFRDFCVEHGFESHFVSDINQEEVRAGEVYINLMEDDLVVLIKRVKECGLNVGTDVGIISYNETPLKEILLDGITVISTDFQQLGETAARMLLEGQKQHVANPFHLVIRRSL
jgi:DNA-binding transcriptional regulator YhcF (GntR family)